MKKGIHPTYFTQATIACACGAVLETGSTVETMHTEICALCHPLYTGKKKTIDTTGRVDRFKKMTEKSQATQVARKKTSTSTTRRDGPKTEKKEETKKEKKSVKA